jgi:hypothetical protein
MELPIINYFNEKKSYNVIQSNYKYAVIDGYDKENNIVVEIKRRTCCYNKYYDTIIGKNKFIYARDKFDNADFFIIIHFTDGIYIYKDDIELTNTFNTSLGLEKYNEQHKTYIHIPIKYMEKI